MGVRFPGVGINTPIVANLLTSTISAIFTCPPLNLSLDFQQVILMGMYMFVPGTGCTSVTFRLHNGPTTAGAQFAQWSLPVTAAIVTYTSFSYPFIPGAVAGVQFTFSGQQVGASAPATSNDGSFIVFCL